MKYQIINIKAMLLLKGKIFVLSCLMIFCNLELFLIFNPLQSTKFYGFEYEDSFISAHVSSQENLTPFMVEYRTQGCESRVNGKCISVSSYTGHYITYSARQS